jgi:hypothetical protein
LEFLVQLYKILTRLDAAGFSLQNVFGDNKMQSHDDLLGENEDIYLGQEDTTQNARKQQFKNWIVNLDVWGSFEPLNA